MGHSSFFIKGKTASLVTDPFDPKMVGLKFPKVKADIVTISHHHQDHDKAQLVEGNPLVIDLPGEYEKNQVRVTGFSAFHDKKKGQEGGKNTLFKIEMDEISVLHCGDLGDKLSDEMLEEMGKVDILLIPVGGVYTIDDDEAVGVVNSIEPSIVIPMHYKSDKLNEKVFGKLSPLSSFLDKMGMSDVGPIKKLKVKKEEFKEEMKVVVLEI